MSASSQNSELRLDLSGIEEKRRALNKIVGIARAIENLHQSLESVLILGASAKKIPEGALSLYKALSDNLQGLPVNTLKEYLVNLDMIVKNQLDKVLHYSGMDFSTDEAIETLYLTSDTSEKNLFDLVEDFKRTAQTAVSLRILLKKRGVSIPGSTLPVSQDAIHQQLNVLETQEQKQRAKIKTKITEMKEDLNAMINNPNYPDKMKELLSAVQGNLDKDLDKLDSGGALSQLSFVVDAEEITSVHESSSDEDPIPKPTEEKKEISLAEAANRWLNSPSDVTWKDSRRSG